MRKLLSTLIAATALVPALASAQAWRDPRFQHQRHDDKRDYHQEQREDRRDYLNERHDDRKDLRQGDLTQRQFNRDRAQDNARYAAERRDNVRDYHGELREDRHDAYQRQWSRDWRSDHRYDWSHYRTTNRAAFHLPRYYGPAGWHGSYTRINIGIHLSAPLWGRSYWISNPYTYRLPPVYGPYQWVRYYNDALLIDTRSGVVVDTAYGIFW